MKKAKKRLGCLLAIMTVFLMLSATVSAGGARTSGGPVTVKGKDGTQADYATLYEAAAAAKDGDTLLLQQDIQMQYFKLNGKQQKPTMRVENKSLILDGQGHTVTANPDEAFSMLEVRPGGKLTLMDITMDGSASENRRYSNILLIEGGEAVIEDGTTLKNNCTAAVDIGVNVPGGKCVMNGGVITENVMPSPYGSPDTGVAVTVLEESTFIMNGGIISHNETVKYGSSGIMVNRGGTAILNGGIIEENTTSVNGMASALHIKGGDVELNGAVIRNNTSANGYGAVYVTNHSSFGDKWDGILDISAGEISGNKDADGTSNAIYLWSKSGIAGTGAYLKYSGSPKIDGASRIFANNSDSVDFQPIVVKDTFTPVLPVILDLQFDYVPGQTIVVYDNGIAADSSHFAAAVEQYGFQKDAQQNLLYTEEKRKVVFMDGDQEIAGLTYWAFVEDHVSKPVYSKPGYAPEGWFTDAALTDEWQFADDSIPRETGDFRLYSKWSALPAEAPVMPEEIDKDLPCNEEDGTVLTPDFEEKAGYTYSYVWKNAAGETVGTEKTLSVDSPANGESIAYSLTVTAVRTDNLQQAAATTAYTVSRAEHDNDAEWTFDESIHWHACTVCGKKADEASHEFTWVIDQEATESEAGSKHEECTVCGYKKAAVEIPATGTETSEPENPQTGDLVGWLALLPAGLSALTGALLVLRKQQKER